MTFTSDVADALADAQAAVGELTVAYEALVSGQLATATTATQAAKAATLVAQAATTAAQAATVTAQAATAALQAVYDAYRAAHPPVGTNPRDALVLGDYRPGPDTTGTLPGTTLTVTTSHVPVDGGRYDSLDIRCAVQPVGIGNVTYTNCVFRGPLARPTGQSSLVSMARAHKRGFRFIDCTFAPQTEDPRMNGIQGYGFTMLRCDMSLVIDQVEVFVNAAAGNVDGPCDVVIEQSWFHDSALFRPGMVAGDTTSPPEGSHADNVQWEGATGLVVRGNYFTGKVAPKYLPGMGGAPSVTGNAAMMIKPDVGAIAGGVITDNWFGGGGVTINIADAPTKSRYIANVGALTDNRFSRDQRYKPTTILIATSTAGHPLIGLDTTGNVFDDTSTAVPVTRKNV